MFEITKGYDHEAKTFRLPTPMVKELEQLAQENNISLNQLVIQCIGYSLDHIAPSEKEKISVEK